MHNSTYTCLSRSNGSNQPSSDQQGIDRQNSLMFTKLPLPKLENDLQNYNLRLDSRPNSEQSKGKCTLTTYLILILLKKAIHIYFQFKYKLIIYCSFFTLE